MKFQPCHQLSSSAGMSAAGTATRTARAAMPLSSWIHSPSLASPGAAICGSASYRGDDKNGSRRCFGKCHGIPREPLPVTMAIDTPLGFSDAFVGLITESHWSRKRFAD